MPRHYWPSFSEMRGDEARDWFRRSDIIAAIEAEGHVFTWHDARKVLRGLPKPERRYGHYRYTRQHLDAVLQAARRGT